jgi:hypothetical protein
MPNVKIDGIHMAVKIACSLSLITNHRYPETIKDIITARIIKKSDFLNIFQPFFN